MRVQRFKVFWVGALFFAYLPGCASRDTRSKTVSISPVSDQENLLIRHRLETAQAVEPYEQILPAKNQNSFWFVAPITPPAPAPYLKQIDLLLKQDGENPSENLFRFFVLTRRATLEYFKAYPDDQRAYEKIQSSISDTLCFDDGEDVFCGSGLLNAALFLLDSSTWDSLHNWLHAISKTLVLSDNESESSAAFEDFVRYFVFGVYKSFKNSSPSLSESNCRKIQERFDALGEKILSWEMNLCSLLFAHPSDRNSRKDRPK